MKRTFMKKIGLSLLIGVFGLGFVGCNNNDQGSGSEDPGETTTKKEEVVVGLDNTFVPMGFLDDNNEITGFDVDLAKEVFKRMDREVKFENIDWATKEASLDRGSIDMIWNGYSLNDERKKLVSYSEPYMDNKTIIVVMADSDINSYDDLEGLEIGTQQGSTAYEALQANEDFKNKLKDQDASQYDTFDKALRDMEVGRIQGVLGDEVLIRYYLSQKGQEDYRILDGDLGSESYVVAFRKNDTDFRDMVDEELEKMREDGSYQEIYDKWFDQ